VKNKYLVPVVSIVAVLLSACQGNNEAPVDAFKVELPVFYLERPADALTDTDPRDNFKLTALNVMNKRAGNLWLKMPGQDAINLTGSYTAATFNQNGGLIKDVGDVASPSLNYNGTKLIFSMFEGSLQGVNDPLLQNHWDLWEYEISRPGDPNFQPDLHKLFDSNTAARVGNDLDPIYLPDGRVVFTSDRQSFLKPRFASFGTSGGPYFDELRQEAALNLHIISGSGFSATIRQLSTNMADERYPSVLQDGRIVFTRWELSPEGNKTAQFDLFTINPDGSHLQLLYGAHSHGASAANTVFSRPQQLPDGRLLTVLTSINQFDPNDITTINQSNFGGGDLVFVDYKGFIDVDTPRVNGTPTQTAGQASATPGDVMSGPGLSTGGRYENFSPIWQGSNDALRVMVSWAPCRVAEGTAPNIIYSTCDNGGTAALDPEYGLHILNLNTGLFDGQFALPPANNGMAYVDPVVVVNREKVLINGATAVPTTLADHSGNYYDDTLALEGVGSIHILSVYDTDRLAQLGLDAASLPTGTALPLTAGGQPDLNRMANAALTNPDSLPVRFVRVVSPMMTYPRDNNKNYIYGINNRRMRTIIGYAPVQPDGSVFVKVPGNVPFAFELIDKNGKKLVRSNGANQFHRNWLNVMPGEKVTCTGCHEGHSNTAPLNSGFAKGAVPGVISVQAQNSMYDVLTAEISGGETMAEMLARLAITQPTLVDPTYAELKRDPKYQDFWTDPGRATPGSAIAIEYNDSDLSNGNQGLLYTSLAPVIKNTCAPTSFIDPLDQPAWNINDCMIAVDYEEYVQPMWEAVRPISSTQTGTCVDCHSTINSVTALPQVPAGETQLDLTRDGNGARFINNDEPKRFVSYEEMVHRGLALQLNAMGDALEVVTTQVPDGMGGFITVDVSVSGTLAIGSNAEARNSRLIRILTGVEPIGTVDHTLMMSAAEIRVLSEWIDMGTQYFNNAAKGDAHTP